MSHAIFLKKIGCGTHSDTKLGQRLGMLVIPMPGEKEVLERRSGLPPSEKELPKRRPGMFLHKNTPGHT
jgi:hypothetical protein